MANVIIRTDGSREIKKGKMSLAQLQAVVGGYIQQVPYNGGYLWVNEEGLLLNLPTNVFASSLVGFRICGNVVAVERKPRGFKGTVCPPDFTGWKEI